MVVGVAIGTVGNIADYALALFSYLEASVTNCTLSLVVANLTILCTNNTSANNGDLGLNAL